MFDLLCIIKEELSGEACSTNVSVGVRKRRHKLQVFADTDVLLRLWCL
jgi:hypothetical protein